MLILKNVTAVQLHPAKVQEGVDIAIENDVIVAIGDALTQRYPDASFKVVKQYIFKKYDLKSCKLLKSKNANYVNEIVSKEPKIERMNFMYGMFFDTYDTPVYRPPRSPEI